MTSIAFLGQYIFISLKLEWLLVLLFSGLAYGAVSSLVAARHSQFLAASLVHMALFAATLSIPIHHYTGLPLEIPAIILGMMLLELYNYIVSKTRDVDAATASLVSFTASTSILAIYVVKLYSPYTPDIWAIIIGDPLLVSWLDVMFAIVFSGMVLIIVLITYWDNICIGLDRDSAELLGINTTLHDRLFNLSLVLSVIGLIRITGFIMAHVFLLLPGLIGSRVARNARQALIYSILYSLLATLLGLLFGVMFDVSPIGVAGILLSLAYVILTSMQR